MISDVAEKCRGCTIKHLSEAFVPLKSNKKLDKLDVAYICGNLAHAANHFIHNSLEIAEKIRALRLDSINEDYTLALDKETVQKRLEELIIAVGDWKEPIVEEKQPVKQPVKPLPGVITAKGGCRCRQSR